MIVIPMLGRSSRFFAEGYQQPKYKLPLGGETVFAKSLRSFESLFSGKHFLFLVRKDHNALDFVATEVARLGIKDFRIIEFSKETKGQAESVYLGTLDYHPDQPIVIFNIDTIRTGFKWPASDRFADGFLEVFHGAGDAWSFALPVPGTDRVARTAEKERIADLCSNGLYGFKSLGRFQSAYRGYLESGASVKDEIYIAPLYNYLIGEGADIRFHMLEKDVTQHCGIPADYEILKKKLGS